MKALRILKKIVPFMAFLAVVSLVGCCVHSEVRHPGARPTIADELKSDTVALVMKGDQGDTYTFCAGVWISDTQVLTADHCARAVIEDTLEQALPPELVNDEAVASLVDKLEDGVRIRYFVPREDKGLEREPTATHLLMIVKHDHKHDLALLKVVDPKDTPAHSYARLADQAPQINEDLYIMGHPEGLDWTFARGYVAAYRLSNFKPMQEEGREGPYMQVIGPIWHGNSGGGAYTTDGQLVGICSFNAPAPNEAFFIHLQTIKWFLTRPVQ